MEPGFTINRYVVQRCLGIGGMGEVYLASDPKLQRQVALKRIAPRYENDPGKRAAFLNEVRMLVKLEHPNITKVHDHIEQDQKVFIVMEYVDGSSLRDRLHEPMAFGEFLGVARQCSAALKWLHNNNVAHGDLKPGNILIDRRGHAKLCDFGLARHFKRVEIGATITLTASDNWVIEGTPPYMAPEVFRGHPPDGRSDVFSFGVVVYEMLTQRNPFQAHSLEATRERILSTDPAPVRSLVPSISPEMEAIVAGMLRKDAAARFTAEQVSFELSRLPDAVVRVSSPREEVHYLVVLPFSAITVDPEKQAFGYGLSETLTGHLAKLTQNGKRLQVISAAETREAKIHTPDEALRVMGATVVFTGSVQWAGRRLRISTSLIDTRTHRVLQADVFDVRAADVFETQDRIVAQILRTFHLDANVSSEMRRESRRAEPGVYEFYLQGVGYLQRYFEGESLESAIAVFEHALSIDREYAPAHAGLGEAYARKYELLKQPEWLNKSRTSCEKAMLLDPNLADAQAAMGMIFNATGEYESAVVAFRRAIERNPNTDSYYAGLAFAHEQLGRYGDAEATYQAGVAHRPYNWLGYYSLAKFLFLRNRYAEAIEMSKCVVDLVPDSYPGYNILGAAYYHLDRTEEALGALAKSMELRPNYGAASNLGAVYFSEGQYDLAVEAFRKALGFNKRIHAVWGNLGAALRWFGDVQASREAFEQAIRLAETDLKINPRNGRSLANLASYWGGVGDGERCRTLVEEALELAPDNSRVLLQATSIFEEDLADRDRALQCGNKARRLGLALWHFLKEPGLRDLLKDPRFNDNQKPQSGAHGV
jgi:tetratricopeptide (TPR) repeat protein